MKHLTEETIKKGKLYSRLRSEQKKSGKQKAKLKSIIESLQVDNAFLLREAEKDV